MDEWNNMIYPQILMNASKDKEYQNRLQQCQTAENAYLAIIDKLSPEYSEIIDTYLTMIEELEYRMVQLAYNFGKFYIPSCNSGEDKLKEENQRNWRAFGFQGRELNGTCDDESEG